MDNLPPPSSCACVLRSSKDSDCGSGEFCEDISKQCFPLLPKGLLCPDGDHSCTTGALRSRPQLRRSKPRAGEIWLCL
jgi:hypothetical protein